MSLNKLIVLLLLLSTGVFGQENTLFRIIENDKIGYINVKGETVIPTIYLEAGVFSEGLAFFRVGGQYGFINSSGEVAIPAKYDFVGDFKHGMADVYIDGEVTFINKEEERVLPKRFESIRFIDKHLCVFTTKKEQSGLYDLRASSIIMEVEKARIGSFNNGLAVVTKKGDNYSSEEYGVVDTKGNFMIDFGDYGKVEKFVDDAALAQRHKMKKEEKLINGLLQTIVEGKLTYLNEAGEIVWQEKTAANGERDSKVNITHLNRGHFYAYSEAKKNEQYNGWSVSNNRPKGLSKKRSKKGLIVEEKSGKLYIKNHSKKEIQFSAQDSRLDMKLQAKDQYGKWKDIEYLPSSWCGNSYHTIALPSTAYWEFDLPQYAGAFETSIRAELSYTNPETNKEALIYSTEFKGSVNPGQFWRKPDYAVRGIMDPYND